MVVCVSRAWLATSLSAVTWKKMLPGLRSLLRADHDIGHRVYQAAQVSSNLRLLATIASLSVDEAIWFTAPLVAALACLLVEIGVMPPLIVSVASAPHYRHFALELFNDAIMATGGGALLKIVARRPRPPYAKQSSFHITNGDLFSFPSGHSFYAALMFSRYTDRSLFGHWSRLLFGSSRVAVALGTLAVCWSRAAKGRHFPLDTICAPDRRERACTCQPATTHSHSTSANHAPNSRAPAVLVHPCCWICV